MARLTKREKDVFSLIGLGLTTRTIANRLSISEYTVRKHRLSIIRKMQLSSSVQLAVHAIGYSRGAEASAAAACIAFRHVLTTKEIVVAGHICNGMTSKEIARKMAVSPLTVRKHRENLMRKLGIHKLSALIDLAFRHPGLPTTSEPCFENEN